MYVFASKCRKSAGYSMYHGESKREYTSAYNGLVYADRETKAILRIKMDCVGIPADYPIRRSGSRSTTTPPRLAIRSSYSRSTSSYIRTMIKP